jgi:hypothetical protein
MKLKLIIPATLLFIASASSAQISLGGQAGAVFSKPSASTETGIQGVELNLKNRTSFSAGLIADIPFGESGFRLIPEAIFVNKGLLSDASVDILGQQLKVDVKSNISYIDIPVNFAYAINLGGNRLMVGAGPYAGIGIGGKTIATATSNGTSQKEEQDIEFGSGEEQYKRMDFGANFMAGYILNNGLMFKVNYSLGLANLSNSNEADYKNRYFGVSVAYFFLRGGE